MPDVFVRRLFTVGNCKDASGEEVEINQSDYEGKCQTMINQEQHTYGDILQVDIIDTYYNNTLKTMMEFKWIITHCPKITHVFFVDDDYYVSFRNLIRFIRDPFFANKQRQSQIGSSSSSVVSDVPPADTNKQSVSHLDRGETWLYAGFVNQKAAPMRHHMSKWFISLDEYPYSHYPPYVNAGSYLLSRSALYDIYYCSFYTKLFRFDDIYLAILAKRLGMTMHHSNLFKFYKEPYTATGFRYIISSHGYSDPEEMIEIWEEQRHLGNA